MLAEEDDLSKVGSFYRSNARQYDFLRDELKEAYFGGVDTLGYYGLKSLHNAFVNTDLDILVSPRFNRLRSEIVGGIIGELNEYFTAEKELLDSIDESLRDDLETYIEDGVVSVTTDLSEKVDRGIFKRTFKRVDMDNYSVTEYAERLVDKYIDREYINDIISARIGAFVEASTTARMDYLENYCDDARGNSNYYITGKTGGEAVSLSIENSKAKDIQDLKTFNDATSVVSLALIVTPIGWAGLLVDALDFYNGMTESSKISTMMNQMSEQLYINCTEQLDKYLTELFSGINEAREESQKYITRHFYEVF